jgi:hypothetical protein
MLEKVIMAGALAQRAIVGRLRETPWWLWKRQAARRSGRKTPKNAPKTEARRLFQTFFQSN